MLLKNLQRWTKNRNPRLVAISIVRNEIDIVEPFVRHTAKLVDRHLIVDHCSSDGTGEVLKSLRAEGLPLELFRSEDPTYNQPAVTNLLMRKAFDDHGADWVLPLDSDEFIQEAAGTTLREILSSPPDHRGSLSYPFRTYHPHLGDDDYDLNPVTRIRNHFEFETGEYRKILAHRSVARHPDLHIRPGNHHLNIGDTLIEPAVLAGFELAHFPVRSLGQYIRKISMGELGKDAFGKKRKGLGVQKTLPFEQLKNNPEHFFAHALTPDRELIRRRATYLGGSLRYTAPEEEIADTIQGILVMAHQIAIELGNLRDRTREKGIDPLYDESSLVLEEVTSEPVIRPAAFADAGANLAAVREAAACEVALSA